MNFIKEFVKDWIPPAIMRIIRRCQNDQIHFEGPLYSWEDAANRCVGYDSSHILDKVLSATLQVKRGEAAFERDSVLFKEVQYSWPIVAGLMWGGAMNRGRLSVIDIGGSLGSTYFQHKNFMNSLIDVRWGIVEQKHFVNVGVSNVQDEILSFYEKISHCVAELRPNVALLSGVLQYLKDPFELVGDVLTSDVDVIVVDKTIVNYSTENKIYVQHVPKYIYEASYPCWSFSAESFVRLFRDKYELISDFESLCFPSLDRICSEFKGYIFRKKA